MDTICDECGKAIDEVEAHAGTGEYEGATLCPDCNFNLEYDGEETKDSPEIKKMSVAEFRRLGYLQELNRKFLHPLGLALEVNINDDGTESFGEVWDSRDDPEGILYDKSMFDWDFVLRAGRIDKEWRDRTSIRESELGYIIQPATLWRKSNE